MKLYVQFSFTWFCLLCHEGNSKIQELSKNFIKQVKEDMITYQIIHIVDGNTKNDNFLEFITQVQKNFPSYVIDFNRSIVGSNFIQHLHETRASIFVIFASNLNPNFSELTGVIKYIEDLCKSEARSKILIVHQVNKNDINCQKSLNSGNVNSEIKEIRKRSYGRNAIRRSVSVKKSFRNAIRIEKDVDRGYSEVVNNQEGSKGDSKVTNNQGNSKRDSEVTNNQRSSKEDNKVTNNQRSNEQRSNDTNISKMFETNSTGKNFSSRHYNYWYKNINSKIKIIDNFNDQMNHINNSFGIVKNIIDNNSNTKGILNSTVEMMYSPNVNDTIVYNTKYTVYVINNTNENRNTIYKIRNRENRKNMIINTTNIIGSTNNLIVYDKYRTVENSNKPVKNIIKTVKNTKKTVKNTNRTVKNISKTVKYTNKTVQNIYKTLQNISESVKNIIITIERSNISNTANSIHKRQKDISYNNIKYRHRRSNNQSTLIDHETNNLNRNDHNNDHNSDSNQKYDMMHNELKNQNNYYLTFFESMWSDQFLDVTVLELKETVFFQTNCFSSPNSDKIIHYYNPFIRKYYQNEIVNTSACNSSACNFFPDKLYNLYDYPLKIGVFNYPPYVRMNRNSSGHVFSVTGPDINALRVLSNAVNFTIKYEFTNQTNWDKISCVKNKNLGITNRTMYNEVQIIALEGINFVSCLGTYTVTGRGIRLFKYVHLVPILPGAPGSTSASWQILNLLSVVVLLLLPWTIAKLLHFDPDNWELMNLLQMVLSWTAPREPASTIERIIFAFMLISCFLESSYIFSAFSSSQLTTDSFLKLDNFKDLLSTSLQPMIAPNLLQPVTKFRDDFDRLFNRTLPFEGSPDACATILKRDRNITCVMRETQAQLIVFGDRDRSGRAKIKILNDEIMWLYSSTVILSGGSPYRDRFDGIILRLVQSGIGKKWDDDHFRRNDPKPNQWDSFKSETNQENTITKQLVQLLIFGWTSSFLAILAEMIIHVYYLRRRKVKSE